MEIDEPKKDMKRKRVNGREYLVEFILTDSYSLASQLHNEESDDDESDDELVVTQKGTKRKQSSKKTRTESMLRGRKIFSITFSK
jgi:hypothetical protein